MMKYKAEIDTSAYKDFKFSKMVLGNIWFVKMLELRQAMVGYHYISRNVKKERNEVWRNCML